MRAGQVFKENADAADAMHRQGADNRKYNTMAIRKRKRKEKRYTKAITSTTNRVGFCDGEGKYERIKERTCACCRFGRLYIIPTRRPCSYPPRFPMSPAPHFRPTPRYKHYALLNLLPSAREGALPAAVRGILGIIHGALQADEKLALEIVAKSGKVNYYLMAPRRIEGVVRAQLHAIYPASDINEVDDYVPGANGRTLQMWNFDGPLPIEQLQTYSSEVFANNDLLAALTNSMLLDQEDREEAWLQIVLRPLDSDKTDLAKKLNHLRAKGKAIDWLTEAHLKDSGRHRFLSAVFTPRLYLMDADGAADGLDEALKEAKEKTITLHKETAEKLGDTPWAASMRLAVIGGTRAAARANVIAQSLTPMAKTGKLKLREATEKTAAHGYQQRSTAGTTMALGSTEAATLWHLPQGEKELGGIAQIRAVKLEPPSNLPKARDHTPEQLTTIGKTNYRGGGEEFGMLQDDRLRHTYIIGKTGMGKSVLLENMIASDVLAGRGCAVVDPHGDLAEGIIAMVPPHRTNDLVIFDPADREYPVSFNMLEVREEGQRELVASGLVGIFKKLFSTSWGPRLEYMLRNTILTLIANPGQSLMGITLMLTNKPYRRQMVNGLTDPVLLNFWNNEFEKMDPKQINEAISPILNKVGQFLSFPMVRNIIGQSKSAIDFRFAMDKGKIVIVNISKGKIGEDNSALLGSMIITKFQIDAMTRANIPEKERRDFFLYVDEFQNFATDSFASILSEARKYRLALVMANQYISQMSDEVREAIFGNVGTLISFQVGANDAEVMSKQFAGGVSPTDLLQLPKYNIYTRMLIGGMPSPTFSAGTMPPPAKTNDGERLEKILRFARERYAKPRAQVEEKMRKFAESLATGPSDGGDKPQWKKDKEAKAAAAAGGEGSGAPAGERRMDGDKPRSGDGTGSGAPRSDRPRQDTERREAPRGDYGGRDNRSDRQRAEGNNENSDYQTPRERSRENGR